MSRITATLDGPTELDQVWGYRPDFYRLFMEDYNRSLARVEPTLLELCRVRIAQLVGSTFDQSLRYRPAAAAGLTDEKTTRVSQYATSPEFSERERTALAFAEQFVMQSSAITDEEVAELQRHLTPEEFIYFVKALNVMDQFSRANSAFGLRAPTTPPPTMGDFDVQITD